MENACRIWHLCADNNVRSIVVLSVSSFKVRSFGSCNVFKYSRTLVTSHISWYHGSDVLSSNTPLMNRHTKGCVPKGVLSDNIKIDERALLAVFRHLYPMPSWNSSPKKLMPSATGGQMGLMFLLRQYSFQFDR